LARHRALVGKRACTPHHRDNTVPSPTPRRNPQRRRRWLQVASSSEIRLPISVFSLQSRRTADISDGCEKPEAGGTASVAAAAPLTGLTLRTARFALMACAVLGQVGADLVEVRCDPGAVAQPRHQLAVMTTSRPKVIRRFASCGNSPGFPENLSRSEQQFILVPVRMVHLLRFSWRIKERPQAASTTTEWATTVGMPTPCASSPSQAIARVAASGMAGRAQNAGVSTSQPHGGRSQRPEAEAILP